ncbi:hypothetical protein FOMPIDRAFT_1033536 [Fomitopsis schrenkii]|uniref:Uncharacterized protein n=1 Tax=Fomitopsis schrenkii TaxID=2126942 RepID=S8DMN9_FOMSC|nr:hypothetical protein FOMPIDRAFT_1033536 [Fomitopsis schrenkii]
MKGNVDDHQQYDERRWSEVFPPHTALTFAAVWDPVEGMITFSGAHLLDSEGNEHIAATRPLPKDAVDSQSQALTIDMLLHHINNAPCQNAQNAYERDPSAWGCDAQTDTDGVNSQFLPQWLGVPHGLSTGLNSPAFASSAALTLMLPTEPDMPTMQQKYLNALRAAGGRIGGPTGVPLRPLHAHKESYDSDDTVTDEGFFEGSYLPNASCGSLPVLVNLNLKSRFSVTTTSTNRYVEVDFPSEFIPYDNAKYTPLVSGASSWQTVRGANRQFCLNVPPSSNRPRRLLRKRTNLPPTPSPSPIEPKPASPQSVLARKRFNHGKSDVPASPSPSPSPTRVRRAWPRPPTPPPMPSLPKTLKRKASHARAKMMDRLGLVVGKNDEDGWVCVEVEQRVIHRVAHNIF